MQRLAHLLFEEPSCDQEVFVGTFSYIDPNGEETEADFYIRCCEVIDSIEESEDASAYLRRERREIEYNAQWAHQFEALNRSGCTNIAYKAVKPSPIF